MHSTYERRAAPRDGIATLSPIPEPSFTAAERAYEGTTRDTHHSGGLVDDRRPVSQTGVKGIAPIEHQGRAALTGSQEKKSGRRAATRSDTSERKP